MKPIIEWVDIPAGTFLMGSPYSDANMYDRKPQHQITLNAFKMSKFAITFEQYDAFCEATKKERPYGNNRGGDKCAVNYVNWYDATAFADWMGCRLPSEAEWEYACRAGTTTPFNTGNVITTAQANFNGASLFNKGGKGENRGFVMEVGSFPPNAWGLYDMHGNVEEWCCDFYKTNFDNYFIEEAKCNPQEAPFGSERVFRGGSWLTDERQCKSSACGYMIPFLRSGDLGFRLILLDVKTDNLITEHVEVIKMPSGKTNIAYGNGTWKEKVFKRPVFEWASIPAGTFTMGSPKNEADREYDEDQHQVTLSAFTMSKCEVTVAQFNAFVEATGYLTSLERRPGLYNYDIWTGLRWEYKIGVNWRHDINGNFLPKSDYDQPVIHVSWNDAVAFAYWMGCRLPTEAEWEYACRAGTTTPFNTGNDLLLSHANYNSEYKSKVLGQPCSVGSYPPNAWGLYDMHGNVWEWCQDWGDSSSYPYSNQSDPTGPIIGSDRVFRGGSWVNGAKSCRSANRHYIQNFREYYVGFRLVSPDTQNGPFPKPKIEWAEIPSGSFIMGSPKGEENEVGQDYRTEETQHQVTLSSYKISKYAITVRQFKAFIDATGYETDAEKYKGGSSGYDRANWRYDEFGGMRNNWDCDNPVIHVSWNDAQAFAEWMGCRLPTEAEWEYACRAGTTTPFHFGNSLNTDLANFNGKKYSEDCIIGIDRKKILPVGSLVPNAWGLYDMHGNVWELCSDFYDDYSAMAQTDPQGPSSGVSRVIRGGSFLEAAQLCRTGSRRYREQDTKDQHTGFRLAFSENSNSTTDFVTKKDEIAKLPLGNFIIFLKNGKWNENIKHLIDWADIPAGTFVMGSPESETDIEYRYREAQSQVTLSGFKMSKYAITFNQYDMFCELTNRKKPDDKHWGRGSRPVINVNWDDATAFAQWLGCRLPTEAEWEYACRAGTTTPFNTGMNLTYLQANFNDELYFSINRKSKRDKTLPVGTFAPNAWGLYDMHGNVSEWCSDRYSEQYAEFLQPIPKGTETVLQRICRDGSWASIAENCRSASRHYQNQDCISYFLGFRIVSDQ